MSWFVIVMTGAAGGAPSMRVPVTTMASSDPWTASAPDPERRLINTDPLSNRATSDVPCSSLSIASLDVKFPCSGGTETPCISSAAAYNSHSAVAETVLHELHTRSDEQPAE